MKSQCHFVLHEPTRPDLRSNLGLRDERPATDRLSRGTALSRRSAALRNVRGFSSNRNQNLNS